MLEITKAVIKDNKNGTNRDTFLLDGEVVIGYITITVKENKHRNLVTLLLDGESVGPNKESEILSL